MIALLPHARAQNAIDALRSGAREAGNVLGGNDNAPERVLNAYRRWIGQQIVQIGQWLTNEEIARVLTTPRYWSLHNLETSTFGPAELADFVRLELTQRKASFQAEADALEHEASRWQVRGRGSWNECVAVAVDTNVMLTHHEELSTFDWHARLDIRIGTPLILGVSLRVVQELDRQKMANNNNINRGTKNELRKDARAALRLIEDHIVDPDTRAVLRQFSCEQNQIASDLSLLLIADNPLRPPLADPDSDIVDRAASVRPFAEEVHFVSYDAAAVFKARQVGLKGKKLVYARGSFAFRGRPSPAAMNHWSTTSSGNGFKTSWRHTSSEKKSVSTRTI